MANQTTATEEGLVRLTEGISLTDLISNDGTTFEVNFNDIQDEDEGSYEYDRENLYKYGNPQSFGLVDEDTYDDTEPFECLSKKMVNVTSDGKIKKRLIREGYASAEELPAQSTVTVEYNAYLEYNDEPFDSTYLRKRSCTFRLDDGQVLPGLDVAVQTMKLNEKSQFLIHWDYAYGKIGCPPRIPEEAPILYEVELKKCVDSGACVSYPTLDKEQKQEFSEIYKFALALSVKGKDLYGKGLIKQAIREYNTAVSKLESCQLRDYADQEKQQALLLRLRSNLLIANTKIQEPRRACFNYNQICYICKGTDLNISAKIYFNHARALMQLSDFHWAEKQLKKAHQLEPQNKEIVQQFDKLNAKKKESRDRDVAFAKGFLSNTKKQLPIENEDATKEFQDTVSNYCKELIQDKDTMQYHLPDKLTKKEIELVEKEAVRNGLELRCYKESDKGEKYFITKPLDADQNK